MAIELVSKLRDRGHDTHIHIAGPQGDSKYSDRILAQADRCSFIHYEGKLPRKEYIDLIRSHRYGIHAMPNEHFGITVAEMVAGGCVPIVPNDGGQTEIVNNNENLLYADFDEAIERLDTLLSSPALEQDLRDELTAYPYRVERFKNKFNKIIDRRLSDQNSSVLARSN
jgi:glycosyltransferase involved in cell wall biosynthesis